MFEANSSKPIGQPKKTLFTCMTQLQSRRVTAACVSRAGHDTTASAVSWALYSLCEHPACQQEVQQEIDTVLQGRDSDDIEW